MASPWHKWLRHCSLYVVNYRGLTKAIALPLTEMIGRIYRIPIAAAVMGWSVVLLAQQLFLEWNAGPVALLFLCVPFGVVVYGLLLGLIWLVSGRPPGPEQEVVELISRGASRLPGLRRMKRV